MPPAAPRRNGPRREERNGGQAESPPDMKHYAIMGGLLAGPPILVLIVFLALYTGRPRTVEADLRPTDTDTVSEADVLTRLQEQEREASRKVMRLLSSAQSLHQRSKLQVQRFYNLEDDDKKMDAWRKAEGILRDAQKKLEEASRSDRFRKHTTGIEDLKTMVDRDLHNILKDKPLFIENEDD